MLSIIHEQENGEAATPGPCDTPEHRGAGSSPGVGVGGTRDFRGFRYESA